MRSWRAKIAFEGDLGNSFEAAFSFEMEITTPTDEPHEADPAKDTRAELQRKFMLKMMFKTLRVRHPR